MAFDPGRGKLRLIPFTTGELLVHQVPTAADGMLLTQHREYRQAGPVQVEYRWRLTESWMFERAGERVLE